MNDPNIYAHQDYGPASNSDSVRPIHPHPDLVNAGKRQPHKDLKNSRANLVLLLGILSLVICWPLGVVAWIMGGSDLRKIREGIMFPGKVKTLKIGRFLGIIGTIFFGIALVLSTLLVSRVTFSFNSFVKSGPLHSEQIVFVGEWFGRKGTLIRIGRDGKADYRAGNATVSGGQVFIRGDSLSISIVGLSRSWHIERRPCLIHGNWTMKLDGEEFIRRSEDLLV